MFEFKHKFTILLQTVPDIADYLLPVEEILRLEDHLCLEQERALLSLPVKFGSLGLQNLCKVENIGPLDSKEIRRALFENEE